MSFWQAIPAVFSLYNFLKRKDSKNGVIPDNWNNRWLWINIRKQLYSVKSQFLKQACFYKTDIVTRHSATQLWTSQYLRYAILHIRILKSLRFISINQCKCNQTSNVELTKKQHLSYDWNRQKAYDWYHISDKKCTKFAFQKKNIGVKLIWSSKN